MAITFVGQSKAQRNLARSVAVDYLIAHPKENVINVYRRQFNYHKEKDEIVLAGYVTRHERGSFYWMPFGNDKSSGTFINRQGESMDPVWWFQVRTSRDGKDIAVEKTLVDARRSAVRILKTEGGNNLYIIKYGCYAQGIVSKAKDRIGEFVWITYKNPSKPVAFGDQYVLKTDGTLGKKL